MNEKKNLKNDRQKYSRIQEEDLSEIDILIFSKNPENIKGSRRVFKDSIFKKSKKNNLKHSPYEYNKNLMERSISNGR